MRSRDASDSYGFICACDMRLITPSFRRTWFGVWVWNAVRAIKIDLPAIDMLAPLMMARPVLPNNIDPPKVGLLTLQN